MSKLKKSRYGPKQSPFTNSVSKLVADIMSLVSFFFFFFFVYSNST